MKNIIFNIIYLATCQIAECNDRVIAECRNYDAVFTVRIIRENGNGDRIVVIDKILKGEVSGMMLKHANLCLKFPKLRSNKIIYMFYPNGEKSYESHTIDKNEGFDLRIDGKEEFCLVKSLVNGLAKE